MNMETHYTWDLEGFPTKTEKLVSPAFSGILGGRLLEWVLELYPDGNGSDYVGYVSVYLHLRTSDIPETEVWSKVSLIDLFDVKLVMEQSGAQTNTKFPTASGSWGWHKFLRRDVIFNKGKRLLLDGTTLRVHCCISSRAQVNHCIDHYNIALSGENPNVGLWQQYQEEKFVDFTIKVGDKEFNVHKSILAARSDVFDAMLTHDLKENTTNTVLIEDIDPAVFEETIRFIYLDEVDYVDELAVGLLTCAEKYHLKKLKALCVCWLSENMSVATVADILVAAHLNSAPSLKARAITYVTKNLKEVMKTGGWKIALSYGDLMNAICEELAEFVLK